MKSLAYKREKKTNVIISTCDSLTQWLDGSVRSLLLFNCYFCSGTWMAKVAGTEDGWIPDSWVVNAREVLSLEWLREHFILSCVYCTIRCVCHETHCMQMNAKAFSVTDECIRRRSSSSSSNCAMCVHLHQHDAFKAFDAKYGIKSSMFPSITVGLIVLKYRCASAQRYTLCMWS